MKKILIILLTLLTVSLYSFDQKPTFSISAGTEYLEEFYMNFSFSIIQPLQNNMELDLKTSLNIKTEEVDGKVEPSFNVPFKLDINFLFPLYNELTLVAGTGLSPTIKLKSGHEGFLMGPNIKLGVRYKVHPSMSIYLEGIQSLLIGPPDWMYPSTDISVGVNFFI